MSEPGDNESMALTVVMPAYMEAGAVGQVVGRVAGVLKGLGKTFEILVVDDGSPDETAAAAAAAGARVVSHPYNMGNGAAVKTGIRNARGRDILLMDADGQHQPEDIPRLLEKLEHYDLVVGARTGDSETSAHRDIANLTYNGLASYVSGRKIEDLTSGFRAVRGHVAREFVNLLPNTFSYPSTLTLAVVRSGYSLHYVPIRARKRTGKSKIRLFTDGSRFFLIILKIATVFSPMRVFLPVAGAMFLAGLFWGLYKVVYLDSRYGPTSAMLMTMAVVVFLVGLVSEQVTQLRFDHLTRDPVVREIPPGGQGKEKSP